MRCNKLGGSLPLARHGAARFWDRLVAQANKLRAFAAFAEPSKPRHNCTSLSYYMSAQFTSSSQVHPNPNLGGGNHEV
jgi:hypothetical protein